MVIKELTASPQREKAACVFKVSVATAGSLTPDAPQLEGSRLKISAL